MRKIEEAKKILKLLGMPNDQQNDRSALILLALLKLKPQGTFSSIEKQLRGITPMMDWIKKYYQKSYAPNSRETFRRFTLHQFVEGGIALYNPDEPERPTNSPKACYQIAPEVFCLLKHYQKKTWQRELKKWQADKSSLIARYSQARTMEMIPVKLSDGSEFELSPGKHNELIKNIIKDFAPRFAAGAQVIYVGDTGSKEDFLDDEFFKKYGIKINKKGKLPDVILFVENKNWLYLIESVTSHGPVDSKRKIELEKIFNVKMLSNIYVTAFQDRTVMRTYLSEIAWESEVWVASDPTHLIHFNGHKFMGPF